MQIKLATRTRMLERLVALSKRMASVLPRPFQHDTEVFELLVHPQHQGPLRTASAIADYTHNSIWTAWSFGRQGRDEDRPGGVRLHFNDVNTKLLFPRYVEKNGAVVSSPHFEKWDAYMAKRCWMAEGFGIAAGLLEDLPRLVNTWRELKTYMPGIVKLLVDEADRELRDNLASKKGTIDGSMPKDVWQAAKRASDLILQASLMEENPPAAVGFEVSVYDMNNTPHLMTPYLVHGSFQKQLTRLW